MDETTFRENLVEGVLRRNEEFVQTTPAYYKHRLEEQDNKQVDVA